MSRSARSSTQPLADVALLLEGTYPYVRGGVSSWVHAIVSGLPDLTFALVFIGGDRSTYGPPAYTLPPNVVHFESHYVSDPPRLERPRLRPGRSDAFDDSRRLHEYFRDPQHALPDGLLGRIFKNLGSPRGMGGGDFLHSEAAWEQVCVDYRKRCTDPSFLDYFWSVRVMHAPIFKLAEIAEALPVCRSYHSISTGYGGLLGAILKHRHGRPFVLTEHGIYTKERKIDLAHADWIRDPEGDDGAGYVRRLWIRFFEGIGRLAYEAADPIVSLYEGNRQRQVADGADEQRTRVVPNGIEVRRFSALRRHRPEGIPPVLGLLGRVVPIKDVKTFIRAMRIVLARRPEAEGWIIGPVDEAPDYASECTELVRGMGLQGRVRFLGFQKPEDVLPKLGLLVLTSISEALPLVVLEGFASGLPAVATDVGACRELIEGGSAHDRALGRAGAVVQIADPAATADAALALLGDESAWRAAQQAGIRRVERYYSEAEMLTTYRAIYRRAAFGEVAALTTDPPVAAAAMGPAITSYSPGPMPKQSKARGAKKGKR